VQFFFTRAAAWWEQPDTACRIRGVTSWLPRVNPAGRHAVAQQSRFKSCLPTQKGVSGMSRIFALTKEIRKIFFIILPILIIIVPSVTIKNVYMNFISVSLFNFITILAIFHNLKALINKIKTIQKGNNMKFLLYAVVITVSILAYLIAFLWLVWCFIGSLYIKGIIFINTKISI
jgi:hypothetical protein